MTNLIYKDLSYKITGLIYEIDNAIGAGHAEKVYGDSLEELLKREHILYQHEVYFPLEIDGLVVKKYFFDFVIDGKIVVELKANDINYKQVCSQVYKYLKSSGMELGLIYRFTKNSVRSKRIPNFL